MHDLRGYLSGRGANVFDGLRHFHDEGIAVHEGAGERRHRGVAAQDGRREIDDAAHEIRGRLVMPAGTHDVGAFGNGMKMKFVANLLVAIHNVASAEAMVLGMKAGLDPHQLYELVRSGAGNSRVFELRAGMMADNRYDGDNVTMKVSIWQKDMAIIGEYAQSIGVPTPTFSATEAIYNAAISTGHAGDDTASVCAVLESMAGLKR